MICCSIPKSWQRCVTSFVDFLERAGIEQPRHALARGELAWACCFLSRSSPPPSSASRSRSRVVRRIHQPATQGFDERADAFDLDHHAIAGVSAADAGRRAGRDHVARVQRHEPRHVLDEIRHRENQLARVGV
jgi:hypothetical protein